MARAHHSSRRALVLAVSHFEAETSEATYDSLPFAPARAERLAAALASNGFKVQLAAAPPGPDTTLMAVLVAEQMNGSPEDYAMIHVISHGELNATLALAIVGSDARITDAAVPEAWIRMVENNHSGVAPRTLFTLDTCHSGDVTRLPWQLVNAQDPRAWVIAASSPTIGGAEGLAYNGWFTEALSKVLERLHHGDLDVSQSHEFVPLDVIARHVKKEVASLANGYPQHVAGTALDISANPNWAFFVNPSFNPGGLDLFTDDASAYLASDLTHFVTRARGAVSENRQSARGHFAGRTELLADLSRWADVTDDDVLRVITGRPGTGKSAIVGVLACAAHPSLRRETEGVWGHLPHAPSLREEGDVALANSHGRSLLQVMEVLASQIGIQADGPLTVEGFCDSLSKRRRQALLIIDGLDESENPRDVASFVQALRATHLRRGDRRGSAPYPVKVLVGTRSGSKWPELDGLIQQALRSRGCVDLDAQTDQSVRDALVQFVRSALASDDSWAAASHSEAREAIAAELATTLTRDRGMRDWGEFLIANLVVGTLLADGPPETVEELQDILKAVPSTLPEVFELDLRVRVGDAALVRPLLRAVAASAPVPVPLELLPALVAGVDDLPTWPSIRDLRDALQAASFYLWRSVEEDGTTLYGIYHQSLVDYLRSTVHDWRSAYLRIYGALKATVPTFNGRPSWPASAPYIRNNLLTWASFAGDPATLLTDPTFVAAADPDVVNSHLTKFADLAPAGLRRISSRQFTQASDVDSRLQLLAINGARMRRSDVVEYALSRAAAAWRPRWASGATYARALITSPPRSLQAYRLAALGSGMVGVGTRSGLLQARSASTGAPIWQVRLGGAEFATALHGSSSGVSGGTSRGRVFHFDSTSYASSEGPESAYNGKSISAVLHWNGVVTTGTFAGEISAWSREGNTLRPSSVAFCRSVSDLAVADELLIAGFLDGTLTAYYDPTFEAVWSKKFDGHAGISSINRIISGPASGIVVAFFDGAIFVMDSATGVIRARLRDRGPSVSKIVTGSIDGVDVFAAATSGSIEIWSDAHLRPVAAVAVPMDVTDAVLTTQGSLLVAFQGDVALLDPPSLGLPSQSGM